MRGPEFLAVLVALLLSGFALPACGVARRGRWPALAGLPALSAVGCLFYSAGAARLPMTAACTRRPREGGMAA